MRERHPLWTALAPRSAMAMLAYWMPAVAIETVCLSVLRGTVEGTLCPAELLTQALSCAATKFLDDSLSIKGRQVHHLGVSLSNSPIVNSKLVIGNFLFGRGLKSLLPRDLVNQTLDEFGVPYLEGVSIGVTHLGDE